MKADFTRCLCSRMNDPWRHFCGGCGRKLEPGCRECGFVNSMTDQFCGGCGYKVLAAESDRTQEATTVRLSRSDDRAVRVTEEPATIPIEVIDVVS